MVQHWKLDDWMKRIEKVEDIFAPIIESKKTGYDIDNVLIYNYAKIVLCLREILTLLTPKENEQAEAFLDELLGTGESQTVGKAKEPEKPGQERKPLIGVEQTTG